MTRTRIAVLGSLLLGLVVGFFLFGGTFYRAAIGLDPSGSFRGRINCNGIGDRSNRDGLGDRSNRGGVGDRTDRGGVGDRTRSSSSGRRGTGSRTGSERRKCTG